MTDDMVKEIQDRHGIISKEDFENYKYVEPFNYCCLYLPVIEPT